MSLRDVALAGACIGGVLGSLAVGGVLLRMWMQGTKCRSTARLDGKTVVITGANTGIGKETALDLSRRGAKIVMLDVNVEKGELAADEVRKSSEGDVIFQKIDLASLKSVRECCDQLGNSLDKIDILINNAGIGAIPKRMTEDGLEKQIGTNYFGHFLLTNLLMPLIKKAAPGARIINVTSSAYKSGQIQWEDINWENTPYDSYRAYQQSKLAIVLFSKELARRVDGSGVTVYAVHPGVVNTSKEITRLMKDKYGLLYGTLYLKTAQAGAQTSIFCSVDETLGDKNGLYYEECQEKRPSPQAESLEDGKKLWDISETLTGLNKN